MAKNEKSTGVIQQISENLSSLKLTISLLLILAMVSIFGTIIPQNASPQEYLQIYKLSTYKILKILGFLDMYHAPWFFFLLVLLCLNLIFCSWRRFKNTWKSLTTLIPQDEGRWEKLSPRRLFLAGPNGQEILKNIKKVLGRFYPSLKIQKTGHILYLSTEKGKLSRLAVYFIHLSILIILAGALISYYAGFRGYVNVKEGERTNKISLRQGQEIFFPGFTVYLEKFLVSFYPTGAPREFKSIITIFENEQKVITAPILVNQPFTYKGITFYQSSYGIAGVGKVVLDIKDQKKGQSFTATAFLDKESLITEKSISLRLNRFLPDFHGLGPAFQIILAELPSSPENFWVFLNHPDLPSEKKGQRFHVRIKEWLPIYYSGLQVTKDPGVEIVWVGCSLMIAGFYLSFFLTHRRLWARLIETKNGCSLEIISYNHRDREKSERELKQIEQALLNRSANFAPGLKMKEEI